jgi:hypothetical protein
MSDTPETDAWRKEWAGDSQYADPIVDDAVEIMRRMEKERNESRELAEQWRDSSLWVSNRMEPKAFPWEIPDGNQK